MNDGHRETSALDNNTWTYIVAASILILLNAKRIADKGERLEAWLSDSIDGIDWTWRDDR